MASPKANPRRSAGVGLGVGAKRQNLDAKERRVLVARAGVLGMLWGIVCMWMVGGLRKPAWLSDSNVPHKRPALLLFIAIGSAPQNNGLRQAARESWLSWLPDDGSVEYRFFSDMPPSDVEREYLTGLHADADMWESLEKESVEQGDMVLQPLATGYGTKDNNNYGKRARFQLRYAEESFNSFDYFLRVDDDSFLCLHRLVYEVRALPREQFFWGRFWCREGRSRADENFMLFSHDVARLLAQDELVGRLLPFDDQVTLGWNFGYWSWVLNLTVFDDQERIDAQQGYLTSYMHAEALDDSAPLAEFCDRFIYAHHVREAVMRAAHRHARVHIMYSAPNRKSPSQTCPGMERSFIPQRHSANLPAVRISEAD